MCQKKLMKLKHWWPRSNRCSQKQRGQVITRLRIRNKIISSKAIVSLAAKYSSNKKYQIPPRTVRQSQNNFYGFSNVIGKWCQPELNQIDNKTLHASINRFALLFGIFSPCAFSADFSCGFSIVFFGSDGFICRFLTSKNFTSYSCDSLSLLEVGDLQVNRWRSK